MTTQPVSAEVAAMISKTDANSKTAFQRRMTNLEQFVTQNVNPIEQQIIDLRASLVPLYDKVNEMRAEAREHCTHPADLLMQEADGSYKCRFCETVFHVNADD